jgi:hypothetical protein
VFLAGPGGGPVFRALGSLTHISPPATLLPSPASLSRPLRVRQTPPQCYSCRHGAVQIDYGLDYGPDRTRPSRCTVAREGI